MTYLNFFCYVFEITMEVFYRGNYGSKQTFYEFYYNIHKLLKPTMFNSINIFFNDNDISKLLNEN